MNKSGLSRRFPNISGLTIARGLHCGCWMTAALLLAAESPVTVSNDDWTNGLHSHCSGRPIQEFLAYAQSCPDVWIATGEQIGGHYAAYEAVTAVLPG